MPNPIFWDNLIFHAVLARIVNFNHRNPISQLYEIREQKYQDVQLTRCGSLIPPRDQFPGSGRIGKKRGRKIADMFSAENTELKTFSSDSSLLLPNCDWTGFCPSAAPPWHFWERDDISKALSFFSLRVLFVISARHQSDPFDLH